MAENELGLNPLSDPQEVERSKKPGPRPRNRMQETRQMEARSIEELVEYHKNKAFRVNTSTTYIDPKDYPAGYKVMWARRKVRHYEDGRNLSRLEDEGWQYCPHDLMPQYALTSPDSNLVSCDGGNLILMTRRAEIHKVYEDKQAHQRNMQARVKDNVRTIDGELHPFAIHGEKRPGNQTFFPSDPIANSFSHNF